MWGYWRWNICGYIYITIWLCFVRMMTYNTLPLWKFWSKNESGTPYETDETIQFLAMNPTVCCRGGHHWRERPDGFVTCVIEVIHDDHTASFCYHNAESWQGYYILGSANTTSQHELLMLLKAVWFNRFRQCCLFIDMDPHTVGELLPDAVISEGRLSDGTAIYVAKTMDVHLIIRL